MSQENSEQLINTSSTSALKRKFFETSSSRSSSLNPSQARVFDVYSTSNDSPQNIQLLDIFSDELKTKPLNNVSLNDGTETELKNDNGLHEIEEMDLLNEEKGVKPGELQTNVFNDPKKRKVNDDLDPDAAVASMSNLSAGETVPVTNNALLKSPRNKVTSSLTGTQINNSPQVPASGHPNSLCMKDGYDKWPNNVEDAFIRGLRLVMKNGTSKIKLREKNYGRNELISLYIQYFTGEFRTKKQISSHIQVWKKAILNKVTNNIPLTQMDQELLTLIEEGAPQTEESTRVFYETFDVIMNHPNSDKVGGNPGSNSNMNMHGSLPMKSSHSGPTYPGYVGGNPAMGNYPILTPKSRHTANNISNYAPLDGQTFSNMNSYPITPLDYAKSIYENMKSYKCVPAKLEDDTYTSFLKDMPSGSNSGNKNSSSDSLLLNTNTGGLMSRSNTRMSSNMTSTGAMANAKKIEAEQRRMIEELNRKSKSNNSMEFQGLDDRSVSNNSFYDRLPFVQEDLPLRPKDWPIGQDVNAPLYMSQPQQGGMLPMGSSQRSVSGGSMVYQPDTRSHYIQPQVPQSMYANQYLVPMPQQQQQQQQQQNQQVQSGRTMSKPPTQSPFVSYPQQGPIPTNNQQSPPSSAMYFYPRQSYIQSSNSYPTGGPYKSNQSVPNNELPFDQYPNNNPDYQ